MFGIQQAEGLDQSSRGSDFFFFNLLFLVGWKGTSGGFCAEKQRI